MGCDQCQNSLCQKAVHILLKLGICVLTCWKQGVCVAEMGGYVSVAEMGGMCQLQKWGVCIRNGRYELYKWGGM